MIHVIRLLVGFLFILVMVGVAALFIAAWNGHVFGWAGLVLVISYLIGLSAIRE